MERPQIIKMNLRGMSFRGRNLATIIFRGCDLRFADFRETNLDSAVFLYCDLRGANFGTANLQDVDLTGSVYSDTPVRDEAHQQRRDKKAAQILREQELLYYKNQQIIS